MKAKIEDEARSVEEEAKVEPKPKVVELPAKAKYYEKLFRGGK